MLSIDGPSLKLGSIAKIPIKIHWTFSLFVVFICYIAYIEELPNTHLFGFFSYVFLLFVFVIMHEFGHALTARRYGIITRDIIISPIGGIARLERLPNKPVHELIVAIAGPAVNVVLAICFFLFQVINSNTILPNSDRIDLSTTDNYIGYLLGFNIVLVVFNLIPAFPMDGGRVLRSLLAMKYKDRLVATKWAVRVGQFIAVGFILAGIFWEQYMLALIGLFVLITGKSELSQLKVRHALKSTLVEDVCKSLQEALIGMNNTVQNVKDLNGASSYLVIDDAENIIGALPLLTIQFVVKRKLAHESVKKHVIQSFGVVQDKQTLLETFNQMNQNGWSIVIVIDQEGNKKGVVDRQLLAQFISSI